MTALFWLIDTLIILSYRVKPLFIGDGLYIGSELINQKSIVKIVPFETPTGKWKINMLEFFLDDGRNLKVLEKPYPIYKIFSPKSADRTMTLLIEQFPNLKSKLRIRNFNY